MPKVIIPYDVLQKVAAFKDPRIDGYEKEWLREKLRETQANCMAEMDYEAQANCMAVADYIENMLKWDKDPNKIGTS